MPKKIIEAADRKDLEYKLQENHQKNVDKWAKGGYKGEYPEQDHRIVSDISSSGVVRAEISESYADKMGGKGLVRNPFGCLGGGK